MKLRHNQTGDTLEVPPPDELGASVIRFNGRVVETCLYSDVTDSVTTGDGRQFFGNDWGTYLVEQLRIGRWR